MPETESLQDIDKPTIEDDLTEDNKEVTIRKYNVQRRAETNHNIKQSEAPIDKICVGLLTMQAEQKEAMNINNEQQYLSNVSSLQTGQTTRLVVIAWRN